MSTYRERQIRLLDERIAEITAERDRLIEDQRKEGVALFIRVNQITRSAVQRDRGEGIPWHGDVYSFIAWCKAHSTLNWAEWNGRVYRMSDFMNGRMPETLVRMEDIPE